MFLGLCSGAKPASAVDLCAVHIECRPSSMTASLCGVVLDAAGHSCGPRLGEPPAPPPPPRPASALVSLAHPEQGYVEKASSLDRVGASHASLSVVPAPPPPRSLGSCVYPSAESRDVPCLPLAAARPTLWWQSSLCSRHPASTGTPRSSLPCLLASTTAGLHIAQLPPFYLKFPEAFAEQPERE